jgi:hypothetical protein
MSEDNKQSRKERNAVLKAEYEAAKADKKAQREAKKAERTKNADTKETLAAPAPAPDEAVVVAPNTPLATNVGVVAAPQAASAWESTTALGNDTAWADAASVWDKSAEKPQPTRREQREEKKAAKIEAELSKTSKKRQKRGGFPPEVAKLLMEKKLILAQWRSRKIDPNQAVERLSALVATCEDGTTWRLLPRPGGAALVKTLEDGTTEIIEPPQRRRPLVTLFIAVLFGVFVAFAIWSSFEPVVSGGNRESVTTTTTATTETTETTAATTTTLSTTTVVTTPAASTDTDVPSESTPDEIGN